MDDLMQTGLWIAGGLVALAVALLLVALLRKRRRLPGGKGQRLGLVESHPLDDERALMLVRRDDVEHLLLVGDDMALVVESGIRVRRRAEPAMAQPDAPAAQPAPATAPMPHTPPPMARRPEPAAPGETAPMPSPFAPATRAHPATQADAPDTPPGAERIVPSPRE